MIKINGPYDFDTALRRIAFDPLQNVDFETRTIKVPLKTAVGPLVIDVRATGTTEEPAFMIKTPTDYPTIMNDIRDIFGWDIDYNAVENHFTSCDLKELFNQYRGLAIIKDFDLYRALATSIIHQQLNISFAATLTQRFVQTYGFQKDGAWFFPDPETTAEIPYEDLRKLQFSQRKAEYLVDVSKLIVSGELDLEALADDEDEDVDHFVRELVKIRGIGPWTAESLLLFGLGTQDIFPAGDVGLQNAVKNYYHLEDKPSLDWLKKKAKEWAPYRSFAARYLWESLGNYKVDV